MMKKNLGSMLILAVVATTAGLVDARPAMAQSQQKIQREIDFLSSTKRGKEILNYLAFGGTYIDHEVVKVLKVTNRDNQVVAGHVALKVVFDWKWSFGENSTTATIFFDEKGEPYEIQSGANDTTSLTTPFSAANGAIQILGNVLLAATGDSMTAKEKAEMQKAINDADSRELLVAALKVQMRLGL